MNTQADSASEELLFGAFRVAGATVPGNKRYVDGSRNQDHIARLVHESGDLMVAAVFDGCGSHAHSHIGAHVGGQILLHTIFAETETTVLKKKQSLSKLDLKALQKAWAEEVIKVCKAMAGDDWASDMESHFEFTIVGVIMTKDETMIFHAGDGHFSLNEKETTLRASKNAPGYPIYPFLDGIPSHVQEQCWLVAEPIVKTGEVNSLILATDGAQFLPEGLEYMKGYQMTGRLEAVLQELQQPRVVSDQTEPEIYQSPARQAPNVSRTTVQMNLNTSFAIKASFTASMQQGPLNDDLAIIVIAKAASVSRHPAHVRLEAPRKSSDEDRFGDFVSGVKGLFGGNKRRI